MFVRFGIGVTCAPRKHGAEALARGNGLRISLEPYPWDKVYSDIMRHAENSRPFTVGRLAKETGLSPKSIRYYEQEKLIPKAARSPSGYRLHSVSVIERLKFIQKAKAIGFALDDIRKILELTDRGKPCCDRVYEWSERRLHELDEQIKFLSGLKKRIIHYRCEWKLQKQAPTMPEAEICKLIEKVELPEVKG